MDPETVFSLFGLSVSYQIDKTQLKKLRLDLCKKHHPDRDPEKFKEIQASYELLSNNFTRAELVLQHTQTPQHTPTQADLCRYLEYIEQEGCIASLYEALNEAFKYEDFELASRILLEIKFLQKKSKLNF